jgi:DNA-binding LacI/PurR family transcriptional regulator
MPIVDKRGPVRPTIRAIAEMAGVSRTTVSLILANREDMIARFRPETVEKVRQAAESVGYRANLLALSLRSPRPTFFALVLRGPARNDPEAISWHHQAFEGMFLAGVLDASRTLQLHPVVATQDLPNDADALYATREVLDGGVFGAIVRSPIPALDRPLHEQITRGMPVVSVFPYEASQYPSNAIDLNNIEAGHLAARLLHDAGRRRLLFFHESPIWEALQLRLDGARRLAGETGCTIEVVTPPVDLLDQEVPAWLAAMLKSSRPDGILAPSGLSAVRAMYGCAAAGLRVPDDIALVGSDAAVWHAPGSPRITSVDASWYQAGEMAVRKMAELRDCGESVFENIYLPPLVHPGESCPANNTPPIA